MIFSTGLKKIYETISKAPQNSQGKLLSKLEEKIITSKPLAYKLDLLEMIKTKKKKFSADTADKFISALKIKHNEFLEENNSVALFYKEEKKLMEFFNIDANSLPTTDLDLIINKKDNRLNEAVIKEYITDKNRISAKALFESKKAGIKERFRYIKNDLAADLLEAQMNRIASRIDDIDPKYKNMIKSSLNVINEEAFTDFKSAVNKGYKLRLITEKLLKEFPGEQSMVPPSANDPEDRISDKDFDKMEELDTSSISIDDIGHFKNVNIELPMGRDLQKVEINFRLTVYPVAATMANLMVETRHDIEPLFQNMKNIFQRNILNKAGSPYFSPMNIIWDVFCGAKDSNPQNPKDTYGKQVVARGFYGVPVDFNIVIALKKKADENTLIEDIKKILTVFSQFLDTNDEVSSIMTPETQKEALAAATGGRSTEYGKRDGNYYVDKHDQDTDTDMFLSGDAENTQVKPKQDNEFFGDSEKGWKPTTKKQPKKAAAPVPTGDENDEFEDINPSKYNISFGPGSEDDDDEDDIV